MYHIELLHVNYVSQNLVPKIACMYYQNMFSPISCLVLGRVYALHTWNSTEIQGSSHREIVSLHDETSPCSELKDHM